MTVNPITTPTCRDTCLMGDPLARSYAASTKFVSLMRAVVQIMGRL